MSRSPLTCALALLLMASPGALLGGCATDAVAIDACREIEFARCEASVACGTVDEDEVDECQRIYREHCLHGIAGPEAPTADQQKQCVDLIVDSGELAGVLADDPEQEAEYQAACRVVAEPWNRKECDYLNEEQGSGGADGGDDDG